MTDCKHNWHFIEGTERLRCERCKQETGPKSYEEKVQEMLADALTTGTGMLRVSSEGVERIDPATIYARPIDDLLEDAEKVMRRCQRGTINYNEANTLHAECYGTIGSLVRELRAAQQHLRERAKQGDLFEGEA
jgi:hypothetical protein